MDYIILGLLMLSSRTIYQLRNKIGAGLNLMYSSSMGSIQAAIRKLLSKGYIGYREIEDNGRRKKEYFITDAGREEFDRWINRPVDSSGMKCPELTKIYFMGYSEKQKRAENIRKYILELEERYNSLNFICNETEIKIRSEEFLNLDEQSREILFYQISCARFGRDIMSFTINWYKNFLSELENRDQGEKLRNK